MKKRWKARPAPSVKALVDHVYAVHRASPSSTASRPSLKTGAAYQARQRPWCIQGIRCIRGIRLETTGSERLHRYISRHPCRHDSAASCACLYQVRGRNWQCTFPFQPFPGEDYYHLTSWQPEKASWAWSNPYFLPMQVLLIWACCRFGLDGTIVSSRSHNSYMHVPSHTPN